MPSLSKVGSVMLNGALPALDASSLTSIPAANITGTLPAISGTNLTNLDARDLENALPAISGSSLTGINTVDEYMYCNGTGGLGNHTQATNKIDLSITGQSSGNIFSVNDGNIVCSTAGEYIIEGRTSYHDGKDSATGSAEVFVKIGTTLNGVETRNTQIAQNYNEGNSSYPDRPVGVQFWDVFTLTGTHYIQLHWYSYYFWNSASGQFRFTIKKLG